MEIHISTIVRDYLNECFSGEWFGRGEPIDWPRRSLDRTPID